MKSDRSAAPLIPGFDFLKTLASQAGKGIEGLNQINNLSQGLGAGINGLSNLGNLSGLGGFKQWVAPTLDPDELEKRIEELRTVQFWLEQNARMLGATIQALEVQKMTLSTLRSMNVKMPDLQQVLGAMVPQAGNHAAPSSAQATKAKPSDRHQEPPAADAASGSAAASHKAGRAAKVGKTGRMGKAAAAAGEAAAGLVDPMKWWGALTEQFQSLATQALAAAPGITPGVGGGKGAQKEDKAGAGRAEARGSDASSASPSKPATRARKTSPSRSAAGSAKPRATPR